MESAEYFQRIHYHYTQRIDISKTVIILFQNFKLKLQFENQ